MLPRLCLLATAASLLVSAGCTSTPTASAFQLPPPAACLARCDYPSPPPAEGDNQGRLEWELTLMSEYDVCRRLHEECAELSQRRMTGPAKP